jgi:hypothetical protein
MVIIMIQSTDDTTIQPCVILWEIPTVTIVKQQPAIIDILAAPQSKEGTQMEEHLLQVLIDTSRARRDFLALDIGKLIEIF